MSKFRTIQVEIPPGYEIDKEPVLCFSSEFELNLYIQIKLKLIDKVAKFINDES